MARRLLEGDVPKRIKAIKEKIEEGFYETAQGRWFEENRK